MNLSPRQTAILKLVCEGQAHKAIATRLKISVHTVKTHLERIRARLDCDTTMQAVILFVSMRPRRPKSR